MKLFMSVLILCVLSLFCWCSSVGAYPTDFQYKEMEITNRGIGTWYFCTKDYVKNVHTFKEDRGLLIGRHDGKWKYMSMWSVNLFLPGTQKHDETAQGIFENHIRPVVDKVFPADKFPSVAISIWLVSKKVIIVIGDKHNDDRAIFEEYLPKLNKEINNRNH